MKSITVSQLVDRFIQRPAPRPMEGTVQPPGLVRLVHWPESQLPPFVRRSAVAMKYLRLLAPLDWENLPWCDHTRPHPGPRPHSPIPFIAAFLVKLDQKQQHMGQLRQYLVEHSALTWVLGFRLQMDLASPYGFDVARSLPPTSRFNYVLRSIDNQVLQYLFRDSVKLLQLALPDEAPFGQAISLDTKHIIAWTKENNPKAYIKESRFDKNCQPAGDRDCKLGCKRRRNIGPDTTPTQEGQPATDVGVGIGEFYWGYASGVVATKVPGWGEFVLAEMTQTFDKSDASYFHPLMARVEAILGFAPPFGTMDAAFDAFYPYEYFHKAGGFAAIPFVERGKVGLQFDASGLPLCEAGFPMPLKHTFTARNTLVEHERGRFACPLLYPEPTGETCPINHKRWPKGGCLTTLATSIGTRLRHQLDRQSQPYKDLYKQRTAVERIFSQALALGIERPKLRNQQAITNQNTLIYLLINLRAEQRIQHQRLQSG